MIITTRCISGGLSYGRPAGRSGPSHGAIHACSLLPWSDSTPARGLRPGLGNLERTRRFHQGLRAGFAEIFENAEPGTVQSALDGADRALAYFGGLFVAHAKHPDEHQHLAMMRRETVHRVVHLAAADAPLLRRLDDRPFRDAGCRARRLAYVGLDPGVERIAHDREHPRLHAGALLELVHVGEGLGECFLDEIVAIRWVRAKGPRKGTERRNQINHIFVVLPGGHHSRPFEVPHARGDNAERDGKFLLIPTASTVIPAWKTESLTYAPELRSTAARRWGWRAMEPLSA